MANDLQAAFDALETAIEKQWGALPAEIEKDFKVLGDLINNQSVVVFPPKVLPAKASPKL